MWMSVSLLFTPIFLSILQTLFLNHSCGELTPSIDYTAVSYTLQELNALEEFRHVLSDVVRPNDPFSDNQILMLWLRKQNFDLESANLKFRRALEWRKKNKMESIMNETILESLPDMCWVDGFTKDGSPIISGRLPGLDLRRLLLAGLGGSVMRRAYQCLEGALIKSREVARSTGKLISQSIVVFDANGFNLFQHTCVRCMQFYLRFIRESEEYWPDTLKLAIAINAPRITKPSLEFFLPFLNPSRRNAIKMFGVDKREWSSYLRNIISPHELSIKFGGNRLKSV